MKNSCNYSSNGNAALSAQLYIKAQSQSQSQWCYNYNHSGATLCTKRIMRYILQQIQVSILCCHARPSAFCSISQNWSLKLYRSRISFSKYLDLNFSVAFLSFSGHVFYFNFNSNRHLHFPRILNTIFKHIIH